MRRTLKEKQIGTHLILLASFSAASRAAFSASVSFFGGEGGQEWDIYRARNADADRGGIARGGETGRRTAREVEDRAGGDMLSIVSMCGA